MLIDQLSKLKNSRLEIGLIILGGATYVLGWVFILLFIDVEKLFHSHIEINTYIIGPLLIVFFALQFLVIACLKPTKKEWCGNGLVLFFLLGYPFYFAFSLSNPLSLYHVDKYGHYSQYYVARVIDKEVISSDTYKLYFEVENYKNIEMLVHRNLYQQTKINDEFQFRYKISKLGSYVTEAELKRLTK